METIIPSNVLRWLSCYLHRCKEGLPPASTDRPGLAFDLSGLVSLRAQLFPLASLTSSFPTTPHTADLHCSYADDFTAVVSDHNILAASQRMSDHAADALQWAADHGLQVSVNKSNCTLFTSDTHQSRLDPSVSCNGNTFPLCRSPKLLGVTFDTHFTFSPHIRGLPPASTDRPGLAFDLSGLVSLSAQLFPLASLTSSFPTTPTLQTSIVPMQTTSQPLSLTTIFLPPLSACPIMQLTLSSGRPTTASRSPSTKVTAPCLPPTHTSPGSTLLCPATATLFPSAGPRSFLVSPLIPTSPSPPTSGEWHPQGLGKGELGTVQGSPSAHLPDVN